MRLWRHRLAVRTSGSHPENRGPTPLGAAIIIIINIIKYKKREPGCILCIRARVLVWVLGFGYLAIAAELVIDRTG